MIALGDAACPSAASSQQPDRRPTTTAVVWFTYAQAADYLGLSVGRLRNLVSAREIPVYGPLRCRRFRREMLDLWLTDRDVAMRKFRLDRSRHGR